MYLLFIIINREERVFSGSGASSRNVEPSVIDAELVDMCQGLKAIKFRKASAYMGRMIQQWNQWQIQGTLSNRRGGGGRPIICRFVKQLATSWNSCDLLL